MCILHSTAPSYINPCENQRKIEGKKDIIPPPLKFQGEYVTKSHIQERATKIDLILRHNRSTGKKLIVKNSLRVF